jgi:hypothetical protein
MLLQLANANASVSKTIRAAVVPIGAPTKTTKFRGADVWRGCGGLSVLDTYRCRAKAIEEYKITDPYKQRRLISQLQGRP